MLTIEEQEKLKMILQLMDSSSAKKKVSRNIDVSERTRDDQGRFAMEEEESPSGSVREIRVVKVKGTYGTYLVQTKSTWQDKLYISIILCILFAITRTL